MEWKLEHGPKCPSNEFLWIFLEDYKDSKKSLVSDVLDTCGNCGKYHSIWIACPEGSNKNGIHLYDT